MKLSRTEDELRNELSSPVNYHSHIGLAVRLEFLSAAVLQIMDRLDKLENPYRK